MRFEKGNTIGRNGGRPKGSKDRLSRRVLEDLLMVWDEPSTQGGTVTRGQAALRIMSKERPNEFAKLYASILPRELAIETVASDLDDEQLTDLIDQIRSRLIEARAQAPMLQIEAKDVRASA
jgi:hypothetical protein